MKIETLKPGMTVWSVGTYGVGHTRMRSVGTWPILILAVDENTRVVTASWNGNPETKFYQNTWSKWRLKRPLLIKHGFNQYRLATREEIKAHKQSPQP